VFEPLLVIIDRLIAFVRTKEDNRRKFFADFIETLFQETQKAFEDYVKYLHELRVLMLAEAALTDEQVDKIRSRREEQAVLRSKLRELAAVYGEETSEEGVQQYFACVESLFAPSDELVDGSRRFFWPNELVGETLFLSDETYNSFVNDGQVFTSASPPKYPFSFSLHPRVDERNLFQDERNMKPLLLFGAPGAGKSTMSVFLSLIAANRNLDSEKDMPNWRRILVAKLIAASEIDAEVNWRKFCRLYAALKIKYVTPL
jgi:hypothetical protein